MKILAWIVTLFILVSFFLASGCDSDHPEEYDSYQDLLDSEQTESDLETVYDFSSFDFENYYVQVDHLVIAYFEVQDGILGRVILPEIDSVRFADFEDNLDYTIEELAAAQEQLYIADLIWEAVAGLIPDQYLLQISFFELFTDGYSAFLGSVEEVESASGFFIFSLDLVDMLDDSLNLNAELLFETIIHELGHIITLNTDQVAWVEKEDSNPVTYYLYEYDLDTAYDSYLNLFFQRFWRDIYPEWSDFYYRYGLQLEGEEDMPEEFEALLKGYLESFYEKYENHFVTRYAATSPTEDIAETFMFFIMHDQPEGNLVRDHKVRFFYDFPEMVDVRNHARDYLKSIGWL